MTNGPERSQLINGLERTELINGLERTHGRSELINGLEITQCLIRWLLSKPLVSFKTTHQLTYFKTTAFFQVNEILQGTVKNVWCSICISICILSKMQWNECISSCILSKMQWNACISSWNAYISSEMRWSVHISHMSPKMRAFQSKVRLPAMLIFVVTSHYFVGCLSSCKQVQRQAIWIKANQSVVI